MTQCNIQYKVFHKSCGDNGFYGFSYGSHRITSGYISILPYQCQAGILLGLRIRVRTERGSFWVSEDIEEVNSG